MVRLLEWVVMVIIPAGGGVFLTLGFILHLMGRLNTTLDRIVPAWKAGR